MSEFKLSNTILVSVEESREIIAKFFSKVPKVKQFLDRLGVLASNRGFIKTAMPFNRVRIFPKIFCLKEYPDIYQAKKWMGEAERAGKNSPIQGTNGDIIKLALINVQNEIIENNWDVKILLSIYDEIQTECNRNVAEKWKVKLEEIMINSAKEVIKTVPIKADVKISEYWTK